MLLQKAQYALAAFALFGCSPSFPSLEDFGTAGESSDEAEESAEADGPAYPDAGGPECDSALDDGDGRRGLTDVECLDDGECSARWVGAQDRSLVVALEELEGFEIDLGIAAEVWPCDPAPDLDVCFVLDRVGHYVCGRIECDYLVVVVPYCAVPTLLGWVDAGNDMVSQTLNTDATPCQTGTLGCACAAEHGCEADLNCAVAEDMASVCALASGGNDPCDHGLDIDAPGVDVDGACLAGCAQHGDCGDLTCSPIDASNQGFCAWPVG